METESAEESVSEVNMKFTNRDTPDFEQNQNKGKYRYSYRDRDKKSSGCNRNYENYRFYINR